MTIKKIQKVLLRDGKENMFPKKVKIFSKGTKKISKAHLREVETKTNRRLSKKRERTYNEEFS